MYKNNKYLRFLMPDTDNNISTSSNSNPLYEETSSLIKQPSFSLGVNDNSTSVNDTSFTLLDNSNTTHSKLTSYFEALDMSLPLIDENSITLPSDLLSVIKPSFLDNSKEIDTTSNDIKNIEQTRSPEPVINSKEELFKLNFGELKEHIKCFGMKPNNKSKKDLVDQLYYLLNIDTKENVEKDKVNDNISTKCMPDYSLLLPMAISFDNNIFTIVGYGYLSRPINSKGVLTAPQNLLYDKEYEFMKIMNRIMPDSIKQLKNKHYHNSENVRKVLLEYYNDEKYISIAKSRIEKEYEHIKYKANSLISSFLFKNYKDKIEKIKSKGLNVKDQVLIVIGDINPTSNIPILLELLESQLGYETIIVTENYPFNVKLEEILNSNILFRKVFGLNCNVQYKNPNMWLKKTAKLLLKGILVKLNQKLNNN